MPKVGKTYVKPGGLAQKITEYEMIKVQTIERNNKVMESYGTKPLANSLFCSSQTTNKGKRNMDYDNKDDEDYHPPENEEGMSSSGDDDEFYGSRAKKDNTNVPEVFKHNCLMSVSKKWRDWKDYLKSHHYDIYETDEERLKNCPNRVDPDQWSVLVKFWGGQCAKERSDTNLANREFQTMGHTSGRKAHCRVRAELAKEKGVEPNEVDRITVFEKTHTKSDGTPVDKASEIAITRLKEGTSQVPESLQSPTFREEVFTEVLGQDKRGRVRTYGLGTCPSEVFGTRFTRSQELRDREQLCEELRKEVVDEVRKEVLAEFGDRFSSLERMCARFEAHVKDIGYPLPPSPEADSPIEPSYIRQKGSRQPCNVKCVPDANGTSQQNSKQQVWILQQLDR